MEQKGGCKFKLNKKEPSSIKQFKLMVDYRSKNIIEKNQLDSQVLVKDVLHTQSKSSIPTPHVSHRDMVLDKKKKQRKKRKKLGIKLKFLSRHIILRHLMSY